MSLVQLPPPNIPVLDTRGEMVAPWRTFFEQLVERVGGINASLQAEDATLTALAALNTSAGVVVQTGADAFTKVTGASGTGTNVTAVNGVVTAIS